MSRYDEAEALLRKSVEAGRVDSRLYRLYGRALEGQDRLADAEQAYRRAQQAAPDEFDALADLVSFLWQVVGRRDAALEELRAWAERHPNDRRVRDALRELQDAPAAPGGR
jgi:Flp pilus assembly protein TadD